ncbi:rolling circle replication-associated protein [Polaromonas aquatica]|uniref:rolling circle replication-associated protein n=1 Tax=Polaromonas aquatica TaxID=332657 RepID=UPI003D64C8C9
MNTPAARTESRAAAGLVSVSTTHTGCLNPEGLASVIWLANNGITIDRQQARVTRLRKGVGVAAKLLHNAAGDRAQKVMVTLTYAGDNSSWKPTHLTAYMTNVRNWYKRLTGKNLRYVWVAELQDRGVIHYHAVFWLKKGITMPKADKRGWWPHGMTKTEAAKKPIGYLMSYLSKIETKNVMEFPHGARISGSGGLDKTGRDIKRWVLWPAYLQGNAAAGDRFKPAVGGGYTNHDTGEFFRAEFQPVGNSHKTFFRVYTHPREVDAAGPFSWVRSAPQGVTVH